MAIENEDDDKDVQSSVQENDGTQNNETNEQASTGSKQWDELIDKAANIAKTGVQDGDKSGAATKDKTAQTQLDKDGKPIAKEQQTQDATQQRQSNAQDQSTQQTRSAARKFGDRFQSDAQGNIYDSTGALIAKQGAQRAVFHRMYPHVEAQSRELAGLRDTVKNYTEANAIAKSEGLTLDEHGAALQMFVQWKKDPVKTMQTLLTLAEQGGRDISAIRQSSGPSIADFRAAVREEVAQATAPFAFLTEAQKQQQEQAELHDNIMNEYATFVEEFPDVKVHEQSIANVMRDKKLSHREAYFAVRAFAAERRLDWSKPLADQLVAQEQQQERKPSGDGQNRGGLPRMGGRSRSEATHVEEGVNDQANANDSWDSIARKAMAKAGIQIT